MKKNLLMWDETLFRDPEVFEIDYVPEQFNHREAQIQELAFQIRPGLRGGRPLNTICRGIPGTGKTTSVKKVFSEIEDATRKLVPVYINCQIDNTRFAIFSQIYRRVTGRSPPSSGTSFKRSSKPWPISCRRRILYCSWRSMTRTTFSMRRR